MENSYTRWLEIQEEERSKPTQKKKEKTLSQEIIEAINTEKNDYDAREKVEEILKNYHIFKK